MSRKLILGTVSRTRLVDLIPIGTVNGRPVFPLRGAEDDHPADDDNAGGDNDQDADDENEDDDEPDDNAAKDDKSKQRKSSGRADDFRRMRTELRTLKREKADRERAEQDKALKEKPELERLTVERDQAVSELDKLREASANSRVELEVIKASLRKYDWADIEDVLNDRTLRKAIEIEDDGEISGVAEALKDLAKRKPHFLVKKSEEDDDKSKSKGSGSGKGSGGGTGKSGGTPGGQGNGDRAADRKRLAEKFPILARLPQ